MKKIASALMGLALMLSLTVGAVAASKGCCSDAPCCKSGSCCHNKK